MTEETKTTVQIKLCDKDRVTNVMDLLQTHPEDPQTVSDLSFVTLMLARTMDVDITTLIDIMKSQEPMANAAIEGLIATLEEATNE